MGEHLSALVVADSGVDFTCEIANLTPRSLFLRTEVRLPFRAGVSVTFFSVDVHGEVALASDAPQGLVIVFDAPPEVRRRIASHLARRPAPPDRAPTTAPLGTPVLEEAGATDRAELEIELVHGLTSYVGQRPGSNIPEAKTIRGRPDPRSR